MESISYFSNDLKRYIITATDLKCGLPFVYIYSRLNSLNAKDFFKKLTYVASFRIKRIQTGNKSKFENHFRSYVEGRKSRNDPLVHFHNYPHRPQSKSYAERFNRTMQQQQVQWNDDDLEKIKESNIKLMKSIIWFNTENHAAHLTKNLSWSTIYQCSLKTDKSSICYGLIKMN